MLDSVRLDVQKTIVAAMAQHEAALASVEAGRMQVKAANDALAQLGEERQFGQATALDVLQVQATVLNAKENLAVAQRDAVVASYSIIASIGRISRPLPRLSRRSTRNTDSPSVRRLTSSIGVVRASSSIRSDCRAREFHTFWPVTR